VHFVGYSVVKKNKNIQLNTQVLSDVTLCPSFCSSGRYDVSQELHLQAQDTENEDAINLRNVWNSKSNTPSHPSCTASSATPL